MYIKITLVAILMKYGNIIAFTIKVRICDLINNSKFMGKTLYDKICLYHITLFFLFDFRINTHLYPITSSSVWTTGLKILHFLSECHYGQILSF